MMEENWCTLAAYMCFEYVDIDVASASEVNMRFRQCSFTVPRHVEFRQPDGTRHGGPDRCAFTSTLSGFTFGRFGRICPCISI